MKQTNNTMFLGPVSENTVFNAIMNLKSSNSTGTDLISSNILKAAVNYITYPLTFLINMSLEKGIFPEIFKTARIIPLHKKESKDNIENYRPISLLSSISKVLERIVFDQIVRFLTVNNILNNAQHGFRKNRNTQSAILRFIEKLYTSLDENKKCIGLFMDLSKAFDLVNHDLLKEKLRSYGLRGKVYDWLNSYLYNRKQIVGINGAHSKEAKVSIGVPQGSILGPLLFLIFVNDLPDIESAGNLTMFADDNTYLCHKPSITDAIAEMQRMIVHFKDWFTRNKLCLNTSKTVFINFTPRTSIINESHWLRIGSKSIAQVPNTKFLGLFLDNMLSWDVHTENLCSKLSSFCYVLLRLKNISNESTLLSFYYAQFVSLLRYGLLFWGSSSHLSRVFKLQKRALRIMVGISQQTSCKPYFKKLKLLTLPSMYIYEVLVHVKSNLEEFALNNNFHNYETRSGSLLSIPGHSLSLYEKNPSYIGIKLYNKLSPDLREVVNIKLFKKKLQIFLQDNVFYSTSEFLTYSSSQHFL